MCLILLFSPPPPSPMPFLFMIRLSKMFALVCKYLTYLFIVICVFRCVLVFFSSSYIIMLYGLIRTNAVIEDTMYWERETLLVNLSLDH